MNIFFFFSMKNIKIYIINCSEAFVQGVRKTDDESFLQRVRSLGTKPASSSKTKPDTIIWENLPSLNLVSNSNSATSWKISHQKVLLFLRKYTMWLFSGHKAPKFLGGKGAKTVFFYVVLASHSHHQQSFFLSNHSIQ